MGNKNRRIRRRIVMSLLQCNVSFSMGNAFYPPEPEGILTERDLGNTKGSLGRLDELPGVLPPPSLPCPVPAHQVEVSDEFLEQRLLPRPPLRGHPQPPVALRCCRPGAGHHCAAVS